MTLAAEHLQNQRRKPLDLGGFLKRRSILILGAGSVLSISLVPVFRLLMKPHYETSASLLVDVSKEITLSGREREIVPTNVSDYIRTLVNRITNIDTLIGALASVPESAWPSFCDPRASPAKNAVMLMKKITVKEEARSFLITATIQGEKPRGLGSILNATLEVFLTKLRSEQVQYTSLRLTYLQAERNRIEERLDTQRNRLLELSASAPSKVFLQGNPAVHLVNLEQVQKLYWEAEADKAIKEGLFDKTKFDEEEIGRLSLTPYADERVANNEGINRIEQWTYEQLQTLRANIDGLTPSNKDRLYVEERMSAMKNYLEGHKSRVSDSTNSFLSQKRAYDLRLDRIRAHSALEASSHARNRLASELENAKREASDISEAIFNASDINYTVSQLRERLASLNTRIDDCEMEAKSPIKLLIERRASDPVKPVRSAGTKALFASLIAGFGCIGGICIAFELLDGRVRSALHLEGALQGRSPTPIPKLEPDAQTPFLWITRHAPGSETACALRSLAVRLEKERKHHQGRVFLLAGTGHCVGATAVGLNLAEALSTIHTRILFIEISGKSPPSELNRDAVGEELCDALENVPAWFSKGRNTTGVTVLKTLGTSLPPPARIREFLRLGRDSFDLILVNTDPPQSSDLAQFILLEVDAAVLIAREDHTYYHELQNSLAILSSTPVAAMTAVLNFSTSHSAINPSQLTSRLTNWLSRTFVQVRATLARHSIPRRTDER